MSSSLSVLVLIVIAAASPDTAATQPTPAARAPDALAAARAANGERAKMGLLPRRVARSRVTYLGGAAGPGKVAVVSPALDVVPEPPGTAPDEAAGATTEREPVIIAAVDRESRPATPAAAITAAVEVAVPDAGVVRADAQESPSLAEADPAPAVAVQPSAEADPAAPAEAAPGAPPSPDGDATQTLSPPDPVPAEPPPVQKEPSPAVGHTGGAEQSAVLERTIDQAGRLIVRAVGPGTIVREEQILGSIADLPVLSSRRAEDGSVVQLVQDERGSIEVRRDAVGRFVSARPLKQTARADPGDRCVR